MGSLDKDFRAIYRVLKHLEASMDCAELDTEGLSAAVLGVTEVRLERLLILMQEEGYIYSIMSMIIPFRYATRYQRQTKPNCLKRSKTEFVRIPTAKKCF